MKKSGIPSIKKAHGKTTVKHGKKPPKSGVKSPAKTEFQKELNKWPSTWGK